MQKDNMSVLKVIVLFIFPVIGAVNLDPSICDCHYVAEGNGWFKQFPPATWTEAYDNCALEGAQLATPNPRGMYRALTHLMKTWGYPSIHIYLFPTVIPESKIERRYQMFSLNQKTGYNLEQPDELLPYICYWKAKPEVEGDNICGTLDDEYLPYGTGCYKFHRIRKSWTGSLMTCAMEGSELVLINSQEEADDVRSLFARNPPDSIPGDLWLDNAFVGARFVNQTWFTVNRQKLGQGLHGFADWPTGEPNNAGGNEFCASVGRNGQLFDDPCTNPLPFICKRKKAGNLNAFIFDNRIPPLSQEDSVSRNYNEV